MATSELDSYREQVATIESALQADPNNTELQNLKTELLDLISLTESLQQQEEELAAAAATSSATSSAAATPTPSTPTPTPAVAASTPPPTNNSSSSLDPAKQPIYQPVRQWAVGDKCRALYPDDGRYYEATILNIGGGGQVFSVQYKGYESSAPGVLGPQDLKLPHAPKHAKHTDAGVGAAAGVAGAAAGVAGAATEESGKKKRSADDVGPGAGAGAAPGMKKKKHSGPSEQVQKQQAWQNFAKGAGSKKTKGATPIMKKSIFASPDSLDGKVGVVGSGKGMTQFQQRGKHVYANNQNSA
ncbi:hypothetical protein B0O80DRAFT_425128 [Mortierella sp. GBAus27b]|nr:hypothetical protein BGX31_010528 [Mortierella sp. GBA43]KAI8356239.1 hypothetical protein B0O80DRAFT_425128 [Mortierella sp. GBAus27b]